MPARFGEDRVGFDMLLDEGRIAVRSRKSELSGKYPLDMVLEIALVPALVFNRPGSITIRLENRDAQALAPRVRLDHEPIGHRSEVGDGDVGQSSESG